MCREEAAARFTRGNNLNIRGTILFKKQKLFNQQVSLNLFSLRLISLAEWQQIHEPRSRHGSLCRAQLPSATAEVPPKICSSELEDQRTE